MTPDRILRSLEQLLDLERACLLSGDLGRLPRLVQRKESCLAQLPDMSAEPDRIDRLLALCDRNARLITAAQAGLKAAEARLSEIRRGAPVGTYSRSGEKSEIARPVRTMQRRA